MDGPAGQPQSFERLRTGYLVDEVQVDVDQIRLTRSPLAAPGGNDVLNPYLLRNRARMVRHSQ